jgi:hypothetical protein
MCGGDRRFHHPENDMADTKSSSAPSKAAGGMTKKEAVEKGLQALGHTATPTQLQKHIRDQYKIEMSLKHISVAKNKIVKEAAENKPAVSKPTAVKPPAQQVTAPKPALRKQEPGKAAGRPGKGVQGINLIDIETVKELVERVGAASLKKLIDVMAR